MKIISPYLFVVKLKNSIKNKQMDNCPANCANCLESQESLEIFSEEEFEVDEGEDTI